MAIEILEALAGTDQPLDRFLRDWFRSRRFAGSKDRAAIANRVFDIMRHRASYAWRMGGETPRALVMASLFGLYPFLLKLYADSGYTGPKFKAGTEKAMAAAFERVTGARVNKN